MDRDLATFYDLVRRTRAGVLDWLDALPPEVLAAERDDFAYGSLGAIWAHVADAYLFWVGEVGLERPFRRVAARDAAGLRAAFAEVDEAVAAALETPGDLDGAFSWTSPSGRAHRLTRRWLILHPITHEFHHKGQALALARVLGHPHPGHPDTDLIEP